MICQQFNQRVKGCGRQSGGFQRTGKKMKAGHFLDLSKRLHSVSICHQKKRNFSGPFTKTIQVEGLKRNRSAYIWTTSSFFMWVRIRFVVRRKTNITIIRNDAPARIGTQKPDWCVCSNPIHMETRATNPKEAATRPEVTIRAQSHIFLNGTDWLEIIFSYRPVFGWGNWLGA